MALFFDTETSGLYDFKSPASAPHQPHLVQFAAILDDDEGNIKAVVNYRVNAGQDEEVPEGARNVHGIDLEELRKFGVPLAVACATFSNLRRMTSRIVAHNISFDMNILATQFARLEKDFNIAEGIFCTMKASAFVLKIPNPKGKGENYKWPKLSEAYEHLVDKDGFTGAHDAFADVKACRAVYYKLKELNYAN